ncbi:MAG: AAA family ATPase, partial [Deltaproteobacteria bacterium]|nr:AAA family ATPase [Deltaproteobacteria bacterium]
MALYGRDADLALLDATLAAAAAGRGSALFFTGEAGIGKSTLIAEARARAGAHVVLAGAAWEAGGAPPYWPWQQVLRDAVGRFGPRVLALPGADRIGTLVPEWDPGRPRGADAPDPGAARFALLDAVVRALVALSEEQPLAILLDDLHAADLPTLDLLVMFARELPRGAIAVIAAWREGELAARGDAADRLARASRHGTVQPLRRLTAAEVATWVGDDGAAIHASSEGNPLFVEEIVRAHRGGLPGRGIASVLEAHLALISAPNRELLAAAAVLGREIEPDLVREITASNDDAIAAALREALATGIVEKRGAGWAFRHVLLRDHLYDELAPSRRTALHRAIGETLAAQDPVRAARHLLAGVASDNIDHAVEVARTAAARAMTVYAFEDAGALLERAIGVYGPRGDVTAIELRIELATAQHAGGQAAEARAECVRAFELARALADADRMARAALVYASELFTGRRDPQMVALLEQAERVLPAGDSSMRARVVVRLAAALVPAFDDPDRPEVLAREARAMARRLADDETTMFVMRYASHAHGFRISIAESRELAVEVIALSDKLGRPLEAIEQRSWMAGAWLTDGQLARSEAAIDSLDALLSKLPQPLYRYRIPLLRAASATRRGEFAEARRWLAVVGDLAREHGLDRAYVSRVFGMLSVVVAQRSPELAAELIDDARVAAQRVGSIAKGVLALALSIAGQRDEARATLTPDVFEHPIVLTQFAAEAVAMLEHRELLPVACERMLTATRLHPLAQGPTGSLIIRPTAMTAGELLLLLDRVPEAIDYLERGLALARAIESPPFIASGAAALARALERRAGVGDRERARELAAEAVRIEERLGIHGARAARAAAPELAIACAET